MLYGTVKLCSPRRYSVYSFMTTAISSWTTGSRRQSPPFSPSYSRSSAKNFFGSADSFSRLSSASFSMTRLTPACVICACAQNKQKEGISVRHHSRHQGGGCLVGVAVGVQKLGVQWIASGVKIEVEVIPAVAVDGHNLIPPGRNALGGDALADHEHAVVHLVHDGLVATQQAQQFDGRVAPYYDEQ
eukprot:3718995-Pleurochrysis_carterae.AAC.1